MSENTISLNLLSFTLVVATATTTTTAECSRNQLVGFWPTGQSSLQNLEYWTATFTALPHFGQDARQQTSLSNDGSSGSSCVGRRSR
jgi:hypothetical protein